MFLQAHSVVLIGTLGQRIMIAGGGDAALKVID
jgi:hypothetical protein